MGNGNKVYKKKLKFNLNGPWHAGTNLGTCFYKIGKATGR